MSAAVDVPAERLEAALELLAEVVHRPTFPAREVDRLRDERLNDLLQARADPRRRADEVFTDTIYTAGHAVPPPRWRHGRDRSAARSLRPARRRTAPRWIRPGPRSSSRARSAASTSRASSPGCSARSQAAAPAPMRPIVAESALSGRLVRLIHRPGSVQSELRVGHLGVAAPIRRLPRPLGHRRDPGWPVQQPAQHEAARGEGLHVRRRRRLGPAPRTWAVRRPCRGQLRGHRSRADGPARRADADPRGAGRRRRARGRARLPRRACSRSGSRRLPLCSVRSRALPSTSWPTRS